MQPELQGATADSLLNAGIKQIHDLQLQTAVQTLQEASTIYQRIHDHAGIISALTNLGVAYRNLRQPAQAITCYRQALELAGQIRAQPFFIASALNNLGIAYNANEEFQQALECFRKAIPIYQQMRDLRGEAQAVSNAGLSLHHLARSEQARAFFQQALATAEALKDPDLEAYIAQLLASLPEIENLQGNAITPPDARGEGDHLASPPLEAGDRDVQNRPPQMEISAWVQAQEERLRQLGADEAEVRDGLNNLAEACRAAGKHLEAEALWLRILAILQAHETRDYNLLIGLLLRHLAAFYRSQERYGDAERVLEQSLPVFRQLFGSSHLSVGVALNDLAALHHRQGRYREAETLYLQAIPILRTAENDHPDTQNGLNNFQTLLEQAKAEGRVAELSRDPFTQAALEHGVPGIIRSVRKRHS